MRHLMIVGLVAMALLGACGSSHYGSNGGSGSSKPVATLAGSGSQNATATTASGSDYGYGYGSAGAATTAGTAPATAAATNGTTVMTATAGAQGTILVDASGNSLYRFDKDTPASSACTAACTSTWPPLTVSSGQPTAASGIGGTLGLLARPDGSQQVTYNGSPLYRYIKDAAPGQVSGDGIGGVWHVAKP